MQYKKEEEPLFIVEVLEAVQTLIDILKEDLPERHLALGAHNNLQAQLNRHTTKHDLLSDEIAKINQRLNIMGRQRCDSPPPLLVPFEVAFKAMKGGKTIRHTNWNFEANLDTINPCNGWMPYDLLQDQWIILD